MLLLKCWGQSVNSRLYRQLTIAVTQRHVEEIYKAFNRYDDKVAGAGLNMVFAWQSSHRPKNAPNRMGLTVLSLRNYSQHSSAFTNGRLPVGMNSFTSQSKVIPRSVRIEAREIARNPGTGHSLTGSAPMKSWKNSTQRGSCLIRGDGPHVGPRRLDLQTQCTGGGRDLAARATRALSK